MYLRSYSLVADSFSVCIQFITESAIVIIFHKFIYTEPKWIIKIHSSAAGNQAPTTAKDAGERGNVIWSVIVKLCWGFRINSQSDTPPCTHISHTADKHSEWHRRKMVNQATWLTFFRHFPIGTTTTTTTVAAPLFTSQELNGCGSRNWTHKKTSKKEMIQEEKRKRPSSA